MVVCKMIMLFHFLLNSLLYHISIDFEDSVLSTREISAVKHPLLAAFQFSIV